VEEIGRSGQQRKRRSRTKAGSVMRLERSGRRERVTMITSKVN
jgi:hypothetical protein